MVLEVKSIDVEGRRSYLMAKRTLLETRRMGDRERSRAGDVVDEFLLPSPRKTSTPRPARGARAKTSLIEDLNITAGVKEVLASFKFINSIQYYILVNLYLWTLKKQKI